MPIKAKPISAKQAALAAQGFFSRDDRDRQKGERRYFYSGPERERVRIENDQESSSDSDTSVPSAVTASPASAGPAEPPLAKAFLTTQTESDVDSDEEALAEARRKTQAFLYPAREMNYKKPPPQPNERLIAYEKKKREEKVKRQMEEEERIQREEQAAESGLTPSGGMEAGDTSGTHKNATEPELSRDVGSSPFKPPQAVPQGPPAKPAPSKQGTVKPDTADTTLKHEFEHLLQLLGEDIEAERKAKKEEESDLSSALLQPDAGSIGEGRKLYHLPAHSFTDYQYDALHRLYEAWGEGEGEEGDEEPRAFIATEHLGEAFTLAAADIVSQRSSAPMSRRMCDGAMSMEEVAAVQVAQRNTRRFGNESDGFMTPEALVAEAQKKLDRFLDCVRWLESLIRDEKFTNSVARFLYDNHKYFLEHIHREGKSSSVESYSHEEYRVFNEFSARVAHVLFEILSTKVPGFDETEFAEDLFDTPVSYDQMEPGPMNVVSYPAWRIMLAITTFESFVDWMTDYIREEFKLEDPETVAVQGTRGLKALIASTYRNEQGKAGASPTSPSQPIAPAVSNEPYPPENSQEQTLSFKGRPSAAVDWGGHGPADPLPPPTPLPAPPMELKPSRRSLDTAPLGAKPLPSKPVDSRGKKALRMPAGKSLPPLPDKVDSKCRGRSSSSSRHPPGKAPNSGSAPRSDRSDKLMPSHPSSAPHRHDSPEARARARARHWVKWFLLSKAKAIHCDTCDTLFWPGEYCSSQSVSTIIFTGSLGLYDLRSTNCQEKKCMYIFVAHLFSAVFMKKLTTVGYHACVTGGIALLGWIAQWIRRLSPATGGNRTGRPPVRGHAWTLVDPLSVTEGGGDHMPHLRVPAERDSQSRATSGVASPSGPFFKAGVIILMVVLLVSGLTVATYTTDWGKHIRESVTRSPRATWDFFATRSKEALLSQCETMGVDITAINPLVYLRSMSSSFFAQRTSEKQPEPGSKMLAKVWHSFTRALRSAFRTSWSAVVRVSQRLRLLATKVFKAPGDIVMQRLHALEQRGQGSSSTAPSRPVSSVSHSAPAEPSATPQADGNKPDEQEIRAEVQQTVSATKAQGVKLLWRSFTGALRSAFRTSWSAVVRVSQRLRLLATKVFKAPGDIVMQRLHALEQRGQGSSSTAPSRPVSSVSHSAPAEPSATPQADGNKPDEQEIRAEVQQTVSATKAQGVKLLWRSFTGALRSAFRTSWSAVVRVSQRLRLLATKVFKAPGDIVMQRLHALEQRGQGSSSTAPSRPVSSVSHSAPAEPSATPQADGNKPDEQEIRAEVQQTVSATKAQGVKLLWRSFTGALRSAFRTSWSAVVRVSQRLRLLATKVFKAPGDIVMQRLHALEQRGQGSSSTAPSRPVSSVSHSAPAEPSATPQADGNKPDEQEIRAEVQQTVSATKAQGVKLLWRSFTGALRSAFRTSWSAVVRVPQCFKILWGKSTENRKPDHPAFLKGNNTESSADAKPSPVSMSMPDKQPNMRMNPRGTNPNASTSTAHPLTTNKTRIFNSEPRRSVDSYERWLHAFHFFPDDKLWAPNPSEQASLSAALEKLPKLPTKTNQNVTLRRGVLMEFSLLHQEHDEAEVDLRSSHSDWTQEPPYWKLSDEVVARLQKAVQFEFPSPLRSTPPAPLPVTSCNCSNDVPPPPVENTSCSYSANTEARQRCTAEWQKDNTQREIHLSQAKHPKSMAQQAVQAQPEVRHEAIQTPGAIEKISPPAESTEAVAELRRLTTEALNHAVTLTRQLREECDQRLATASHTLEAKQLAIRNAQLLECNKRVMETAEMETRRCNHTLNSTTHVLRLQLEAQTSSCESQLRALESKDAEKFTKLSEAVKEQQARLEHFAQEAARHHVAEQDNPGNALDSAAAVARLRQRVEGRCALSCELLAVPKRRLNCSAELASLRQRLDEVEATTGSDIAAKLVGFLSPDALGDCDVRWVMSQKGSWLSRLWAWVLAAAIKLMLIVVGGSCVVCTLQQSYDLSRVKIENASLKDKLHRSTRELKRLTDELQGADRLASTSPNRPMPPHITTSVERCWCEERCTALYVELERCHYRECGLLLEAEKVRLATRPPSLPVAVPSPAVAPSRSDGSSRLLQAVVRGYFRSLERYYMDLLEAVMARELMMAEREALLEVARQRSVGRAAAEEPDPATESSWRDPETDLEDDDVSTPLPDAHNNACSQCRREAESAKHLVQMQADAIKVLEEQLESVLAVSRTAAAEAETEVEMGEAPTSGMTTPDIPHTNAQLRARLLEENREKHEVKKQLELLRLELLQTFRPPETPSASLLTVRVPC
eukprot:gene13381-9208_t